MFVDPRGPVSRAFQPLITSSLTAHSPSDDFPNYAQDATICYLKLAAIHIWSLQPPAEFSHADTVLPEERAHQFVRARPKTDEHRPLIMARERIAKLTCHWDAVSHAGEPV